MYVITIYVNKEFIRLGRCPKVFRLQYYWKHSMIKSHIGYLKNLLLRNFKKTTSVSLFFLKRRYYYFKNITLKNNLRIHFWENVFFLILLNFDWKILISITNIKKKNKISFPFFREIFLKNTFFPHKYWIVKSTFRRCF